MGSAGGTWITLRKLRSIQATPAAAETMIIACVMLHDNTPHFADLPSFPDHKHLPDRVVAAAEPMLMQVIEETVALTGLVRHDEMVYFFHKVVSFRGYKIVETMVSIKLVRLDTIFGVIQDTI